jgi:glycerol-3-phosphate acyltransferase PlsY
MGLVLAGLVGYTLGTFPSAVLAARVATRGAVDIREAGTGNPGARNALDVLGAKWGLLILVADMVKGIVAGFAGMAIGGDAGAYAAATLAIAGHIFPVWSGFRGGKGVATSAGACFAVFPVYFPVDVAVTMVGALVKRTAERVTQASCAVWCAAALAWWRADLPNGWGPKPTWGLFAFAVVSSAMILGKFAFAGAEPVSD